MLIQRAEADLANLEKRAGELRARVELLAAELSQVEQKAQDLRIAISILSPYDVPTVEVAPLNYAVEPSHSLLQGVPDEQEAATPAEKVESDLYYGKGMGEAAVVALTLRGYPMTYLEITDDIIAAGIQLAAKTPATSVQAALRSAEQKGLIVRFGAHKWALPNWTKSQIDQVVHANMVNRVKESLASAKDRGVILGRRMRMTKKEQDLILDLGKQGVSQREIADRVRFSQAHIGRFLQKTGVLEKKPRAKRKAGAVSAPDFASN